MPAEKKWNTPLPKVTIAAAGGLNTGEIFIRKNGNG